MQPRLTLLIAAILAVGARAGAQDVRVEVFEAASGKPIVGANVALLDSAAVNPFGGGFSDQRGLTDIRVPGRGQYRVRADKVGYDTWTSVQLLLGEKPVLVRVGMAPTRVPAPILPRSETACQELTGPGTPAGDLWVELKKALTASAMTEAQGLVPLDVDLYERALDKNLSIVSERTEQRNRITRRPSTGISWSQVDSARRPDASNNEVYRAPDAALILSEQFVKSHCFTAIRGYGAEAGLTGLEFKPARIAGQAELTGVLWLDPKANALRSLSYDYVNLPIPLRIARTTGRVEFQQLPGGQWIVPRWYIRMPRITHVNAPAGTRVAAADTLIGFQEVGGAARPAGTAPVASGPATSPSPAVVTSTGGAPGVDTPAASGAAGGDSTRAANANQSWVTGIVYDSTTSRPLSGVQVSARGGQFKAVTSSGGGYDLAVDGALNDTIVFEHPRLRLYRVADRVQTISMPAGSRAHMSVMIPGYGSLRKNLCGQNDAIKEAQGFMAGYVRDAAGKPVPRAHVWATWQVLWVEQNGRLVSTNQQRTVETDTNSDGSYMMCGFTRNAQITVKADIAGKSPVQEKFAFPTNMALEHDFQFGAR